MNWILDHYIELFGAATGLIYLYLEIKQNIWLWPLGILTSTLYIIIFFQSKFYADMALQFYYVAISVYGWYWWLKGNRNSKNEELPVTKLTKHTGWILTIITIVFYALISVVLVNFTDSPLPYWDAFTTALSLTATWMLTHKIIEQWLVWIVVNVVSMGLYIYKGLYPTVILFFFYTTMSIIGYMEWNRSLKKEATLNTQ